MSYLTRHPAAYRPVFTAQPQVPVGIDPNSLFVYNAALKFRASNPSETLTQRHGTYLAVTKAGQYVYDDFAAHAAAGLYSTASNKLATLSYPITFSCYFIYTGVAGSVFGNWYTGAAGYAGGWKILITAGNIEVSYNDGSGAAKTWTIAGGAVVSGQSYSVSVASTPSGARCYINGVFVDSISWSIPATGAGFDSTAKIAIGASISAYDGFKGKVYLSSILRGNKDLSANPWQIFTPLARPYHAIDLVRGPVQTRQSYLLGTTPEPARTVAPAILRRAVMSQQPQYAAQIDWSNPITRGLSAAVDLNSQRNLLGTITNVGGGAKAVTKHGIATAFVGSNYFTVPISSGGGEWTIFVLTTPTSLASQGAIASICDTSTSNRANIYGGQTSNTVSINYGNSYYSAATVNSAIAIAGTFSAVASYESLYVDGVLASSGSTGVVNPINANLVFGIGARYSSGWGSFGNAKSNWALLFNRVLSPQEIKSLSDNPWQIFLAPNVTPWVSP